MSADSVPGFNRLDKLNFIRDIFKQSCGSQDINWMYHDQHAAIIVEHDSYQHTQNIVHSLSFSHPDLAITVVDDLRQLLNHRPIYNQHTSRKQKSLQTTTLNPYKRETSDNTGTDKPRIP